MASFQRRFNQIAVEGNARISDYIPDTRKYKDYVYGRCEYKSTWKNKEYLRR